MQKTTQDSYIRLKQQLQRWKGKSDIHPADDLLSRQFLTAACETVLPELEKLARILEEGGLQCEVLRGDEDNLAVGIRIDTLYAILTLSPSDNPACIRAVIAGDSWTDDGLEWFIPYHQIRTGGLGRQLQAAIMRILIRSERHSTHHSS